MVYPSASARIARVEPARGYSWSSAVGYHGQCRQSRRCAGDRRGSGGGPHIRSCGRHIANPARRSPCARAAGGHAMTVPPRSVMNFRRFTGSPRSRPGGPESRWARSARPTDKIAHLSYGRRLLHCGISTPTMTASGHTRPFGNVRLNVRFARKRTRLGDLWARRYRVGNGRVS
jgi:hypothetical protein